MSLVVGLGGVRRNACVALATPDGVIGVCEQERITRVAGAGANSTGLPDEALQELLRRAAKRPDDVSLVAVAEPVPGGGRDFHVLDHHFAHACSSFLPSPFEEAVVLVCDHETPHVSVWHGRGKSLARVDWGWNGIGLAELYSECATALGFDARGGEQRMEALARLAAGDDILADGSFFQLADDHLVPGPDWKAHVADADGNRRSAGCCGTRAAAAAPHRRPAHGAAGSHPRACA